MTIKFDFAEFGTVTFVDEDGNVIEEREMSLAEVSELLKTEKENN